MTYDLQCTSNYNQTFSSFYSHYVAITRVTHIKRCTLHVRLIVYY